MKKIEAIIRPCSLDAVKDALNKGGVNLTVTEVMGFGRQKCNVELYRGSECETNFLPKVQIETIVDDSVVEKVLTIIEKTAKSGKIGDGKIFVIPSLEPVRFTTGSPPATFTTQLEVNFP